MKNIPKPYIKRYFTHIKENYYKIKPEIRKRVSFFKHNLFKPLPSYLKKIDLILCRNLLIYIPRKRQIEILKHLKVILSKEGYLMLGKTESFLIINPDKEIVAENATEHIYKLKVK